MGEEDASADVGAGTAAVEGASRDVSSLLAWSFAAFHAALLVALVVAVLFALGLAGNQLAALDTSLGLVAYLYLWAVTWWTNRRMVAAVGSGLLAGSASRSDVLVEAMKWGGVAGLLVFLPAFAVVALLVVAQGGLEAVSFLLFAAVVGSIVAGGLGVLVGALYALLDLLLVGIARAWLYPAVVSLSTSGEA